jgi:type IV pilus assembly protein PilV
MERIVVLNNKRGMTLIEVMIALIILMVVSLALMQTALLGIRENLRNALRDEAVNIADQRMNELRNTDFNSPDLALVSSQTETIISRTFRAANVNFTPTRKVTQIGTDMTTKQITITVSWGFAGQSYAHNVTTIMRQQ